jgi:hypothetical protein
MTRGDDGGPVTRKSSDQLVFVNYSEETFTTTASGALATYIYECCRAAAEQGEEPWVISRTAEQAAFSWPKTRLIEYPRRPAGKLGGQLTRVQRNAIGLPRLGQRAWAKRVARTIREIAGPDCSLILQNDP